MGVRTRPGSQLVFVDTPGLHKAVTALGERVNATALDSVGQNSDDVDVTALVLDATQRFGSGDRWVADRLDMSKAIVIVNKIDRAPPAKVLDMLTAASELGAREYFPVSARTGEGIDVLVQHLIERLPPGPRFFPDDEISDLPPERWVAELVREQLLAATRDELPYSIATQVVEWTDRRIRVDVIVERESQKGMVIGKGGTVLKSAGEAVRKQLPQGIFLELRVKVDKDWQRRPERVERLGY
jgi:GTP-binding protein Era